MMIDAVINAMRKSLVKTEVLSLDGNEKINRQINNFSCCIVIKNSFVDYVFGVLKQDIISKHPLFACFALVVIILISKDS